MSKKIVFKKSEFNYSSIIKQRGNVLFVKICMLLFIFALSSCTNEEGKPIAPNHNFNNNDINYAINWKHWAAVAMADIGGAINGAKTGAKVGGLAGPKGAAAWCCDRRCCCGWCLFLWSSYCF